MSSTASDPSAIDEPDLDAGRPVLLEPTPPGFWRALLGVAVGVLAPLFGFLIGGMIGAGAVGNKVDPMALSLFTGIAIGGIGLLVALSGGARLWRHFHRQDIVEV
ncbi:hypothetical protein [Mycobacterium sp. E740]|uniref:hypothetical protein n=1 Tax=Mycobacterium sp. E740 TaxID=1834149 RepID=UPI000801CFB7|nr:hypothetical protein [Mycobacterium sp. E740]OBI82176.1 hypothetical protein A5663_14900 [Mycobacterium sp. E740]